MQIKFNTKSWHFRYYTFMVGKSNPPRTLCPYFWSLVGITAIAPILFLVFAIFKTVELFGKLRIGKYLNKFRKPAPVLSFEEELERLRKRQRRSENVGKFVGGFFVGLAILGVIFVASLLGGEFGILPLVIGLFAIIGVIATSFVFVKLYIDLEVGEKIAESKMVCVTRNILGKVNVLGKVWRFLKTYLFGKIWKGLQIIGQMVKAVYTKSCPMIEWES
jgi:hypothetical protein